MRVTVLAENDRLAGRDDLVAEFGLALHIECDGGRILFDTGTTGVFVDNARRLDVDLAAVEAAVLSHHHFDHGGGLAAFFEVNDHAPVYLARGAMSRRWFKAFAVVKRPIGIDLALVERRADRFEFVDGSQEIAPGVFVLTTIGSEHAIPKGNRHLFVGTDRGLVRDDFGHELVLVVHEGDGMVVFSGCSHNGILNMIDAAVARFPGTRIKAVLGGFHLIGIPIFNTMAGSRSEVEAIGRAILERTDGKVFTGHCTGPKAFAVLQRVMGEKLAPFPTGTRVEV